MRTPSDVATGSLASDPGDARGMVPAAQHFVPKPYTAETLLAAVRKVRDQ
jgi:hypothetical protein